MDVKKTNNLEYFTEKSKSSVLALRGRGKGEALVEKLLISRGQDKKYGEWKYSKNKPG